MLEAEPLISWVRRGKEIPGRSLKNSLNDAEHMPELGGVKGRFRTESRFAIYALSSFCNSSGSSLSSASSALPPFTPMTRSASLIKRIKTP
jgi:hypothetical protein